MKEYKWLEPNIRKLHEIGAFSDSEIECMKQVDDAFEAKGSEPIYIREVIDIIEANDIERIWWNAGDQVIGIAITMMNLIQHPRNENAWIASMIFIDVSDPDNHIIYPLSDADDINDDIYRRENTTLGWQKQEEAP